MSTISIQNVSYIYPPSVLALDAVSLEIPSGCFFGVIGPNGSGKTTLLKTISGYLKPASGRVLISGKDVQSLTTKQVARSMALVQQHFALEYEFTVMDIVLTGRNPYLSRFQRESEADYTLAHQAMERAGIEHLKDRLVTALSGGEWQRMILARALCQQASIMLLDEPVTGLDIKHQVSFLRTAKQLAQQENISVVCVLHDLNLAKAYCDQIALLKSGQLFTTGAPGDVLTRQNLETVYDTAVSIIRHQGDDFILPQY